jgi:hypothetical protein
VDGVAPGNAPKSVSDRFLSRALAAGVSSKLEARSRVRRSSREGGSLRSWRGRLLATDKSELDEADRKLLADVDRYGWHCLHVHGGADAPSWSFSIGVFQTWQHPELVVFGLGETVAHELLTQLVDRIKAGEKFVPDHDYDDIVEGYRSCFVRVDPQWYPVFLGYAQWFYETKDRFPVLQLVVPDKEGRYPWEDGYTITPGSQPLLVSDDEATARGARRPADNQRPTNY